MTQLKEHDVRKEKEKLLKQEKEEKLKREKEEKARVEQEVQARKEKEEKLKKEEKEVKDILMNAVAKMKQEVEQEVSFLVWCDVMEWNEIGSFHAIYSLRVLDLTQMDR